MRLCYSKCDKLLQGYENPLPLFSGWKPRLHHWLLLQLGRAKGMCAQTSSLLSSLVCHNPLSMLRSLFLCLPSELSEVLQNGNVTKRKVPGSLSDRVAGYLPYHSTLGLE